MSKNELLAFARRSRMILREGLGRRVEGDSVERVAYLWFRSFCCVRMLESSGCIARVLTDEAGRFAPRASSVRELGQRVAKICAWIGRVTGQFRVPTVRDIGDLPEDFLEPTARDGGPSFLAALVGLPAADFDLTHGAHVETLGWLYQYYFVEDHERIVDPLHGKEIAHDDIGAATQVFTTEWVVQYIVDNALGRLWLEHHPESRLGGKLEFWIRPKEAEGTRGDLAPWAIRVLDPCVGTGHFLVYAFDVLMHIYRECHMADAMAVRHILRDNLYGLDIDAKCVELASFALAMKAWRIDPTFFDHPDPIHVHAIPSADEGGWREGAALSPEALSIFSRTFERGNVWGSLICPDASCEAILKTRPEDAVTPWGRCARMLSAQYHVVVTNPPYLNKFTREFKTFLQREYKESASDLFSAFMVRCLRFCRREGYVGMVTPNVWMFLKSYEALRRRILDGESLTTLVQIAKGAFYTDATVDICAFVIQHGRAHAPGVYFRLEDFKAVMSVQREKLRAAIRDEACGYRYETREDVFRRLPCTPISFWASKAILAAFERGQSLDRIAAPRQGLATTDNRVYLRFWYEVDFRRIGFGMTHDEAMHSGLKWFPYNKGGEYRKWWGNQYYVVDYEDDGRAIKADVIRKYPYLKTPDFVVKNARCYFRPSLSWSKISSGCVAFRFFPQGFLFDVSGCSIFYDDDETMFYHAALLNSVVTREILAILSPTLNYEAGHIGKIPILEDEASRRPIVELVRENIALSRDEWNDHEISWDFETFPMLRACDALRERSTDVRLSDGYERWCRMREARFAKLKANEEAINRIFIRIYALAVSPELDDKSIAIERADLKRDRLAFLSYIVGCLLGRYAIASRGLVGASVEPSDDVLWISEEPIVAHDLVDRLEDWVRDAFGSRFWAENLAFLAQTSADNLEATRRQLRHLFMTEFYRFHVSMYQRRPIYWEWSAGKKAPFKCLTYLHRTSTASLVQMREKIPQFEAWFDAKLERLKRQCEGATRREAKAVVKAIESCEAQRRAWRLWCSQLERKIDEDIALDLDDGVAVNHAKFGTLLTPI